MTFSSTLLIILGLVAALVAVATAVRSVSRIWLRHWVERKLSGAPAAALYLERPQRLILAATTGVALLVFSAGLVIGTTEQSDATAARTGIAYAIGLLLFGQLVPRAVARRWPHVIIPPLLPLLRVVEFLLTPILALARRLTGELTRDARDVVKSDVESLEELLREGEMEGVGEHTEIAIIEGVVQFGERRVREVMTPRSEIFSVDRSLAPAQLAERVATSGYSRVPVIDGTVDRVVGMVHAFDVLQDGGERTPELRPVGIATASALCHELLFRMLRERRHLAIVTSESGTGETVGLVTLEDLLEELVGEIRDEHDEPGQVREVPKS